MESQQGILFVTEDNKIFGYYDDSALKTLPFYKRIWAAVNRNYKEKYIVIRPYKLKTNKMKLYDFLLLSKNTAKISGTDSNTSVLFEETVSNCEISAEAIGWIERVEKGRSSDPTRLENDDVQFFCTSVTVMVDGFDNIDEIDMPEFPETVVQDFVNNWFVDEMQDINY